MNVFRFKDLRVAAERAGRSLCSSPSLDQELDRIYMCVCVYMCTYMCMYRFLNRETSEISFIFSRRKPRVFPIPFALFFQVFPIPFALFFQVFPIPFALFFQVFPTFLLSINYLRYVNKYITKMRASQQQLGCGSRVSIGKRG